MPEFKVEAPFQPTGDQPDAIEQLVEGIKKGYKDQTLLGVTGSGKTYTVAKIVEQVQKPTLVLAPFQTMLSSTSSLIMTIINQRPTFHAQIRMSKKRVCSMKR